MHTFIPLVPEQFIEKERLLLTAESLVATGFRFASGVPAVRLHNERGEIVVLPFQGQQIWSARFDGRDLTMRSMFDQPRPTRDFLHTFGGFLQHCGATAVGGPGPDDNHPLHGELPNAPYDSAFLAVDEDEVGPYIGIGGYYRHTVAFGSDYTASPLVHLRPQRARFTASMRITNQKHSPMELLYLAHVNFRAVDDGQLLYSARSQGEGGGDAVRVREAIPSHITPGPGYRDFIGELARDPRRHDVLEPDLPFDPEVVFFIDYAADDEGWAHSMQRHPDGTADYIAHRPDQLPKATRWISRTPDQDAIALVEPGTCEPEGLSAERAKGNVRTLPAGDSFRCDLDIGLLTVAEAEQMAAHIERIGSA